MDDTQDKNEAAITQAEEAYVRNDMNLEKFPIFIPSQSRIRKARGANQAPGVPSSRVIQRGNSIVTVYPVASVGFLTALDQRVLYALLLEQQQQQTEVVSFRFQDLFRRLQKRYSGGGYETIRTSLLRLRGSLITWERAYIRKDPITGESKTETKLSTFNILTELEMKSITGGSSCSGSGSCKINPLILANIQAKHCKPVILNVINQFNSEIAQLLYGYIDRVTFKKGSFRVTSKDVFEELDLMSPAYVKPAKRKQTLERALVELAGKPLPSGVITSATIEKPESEKDWYVVVVKGAQKSNPKAAEVETGETEVKVNEQSPEATSLLAHFYQVIKGKRLSKFSRSDIKHAQELLAEMPLEEAKFLVEYAKRNPKFPQPIGHIKGLLSWATEARERYAVEEHQKSLKQPIITLEGKPQEELLEKKHEFEDMLRHLNTLSEQDRAAFETAAMASVSRLEQDWCERQAPGYEVIKKRIMQAHYQKTR